MGLIANLSTVYSQLSGGGFLRAIRGWTDGPNCDGSSTYAVDFSNVVTWADHSNVTFSKNAVYSIISSDPDFLTACSGGNWICSSATISGGILTLGPTSLVIQPMTFTVGVSYRLNFKGSGGNVELYLGDSSTPITIMLTGKDQFIDIIAGALDTNFIISGDPTNLGDITLSYAAVEDLISGEVLPATSASTSPVQQILYDVPSWAVAEVSGDIIQLNIAANSTYGAESTSTVNLVENGDFATGDTTSWTENVDGTITYVVSANVLTMSRNSGGSPSITQTTPTIAGTSYDFTIDITAGGFGNITVQLGGVNVIVNMDAELPITYTATRIAIANDETVRIISASSLNSILPVTNIALTTNGFDIIDSQVLTLVNCLDPPPVTTSTFGLNSGAQYIWNSGALIGVNN